MTFVIKSLAPIVAGGGLGTGGVYVYRGVMPTTWQEYLEREGFQILDVTNSDNKEFKAIFSESEDLIKASNSDTNLQGVSTIDNYDKIREYCSSELPKKDPKDATTREKLIKLCTYSGISTVKAKITENKKDVTSAKWISGDESDKKYKAIFAIYRYSEKFLKWLNEGKENSDQLTKSSTVSEKYSELKTKCESEAKKKHSENKGNKDVYNHVYWWCMELPYKTVQERIQKVDKDWQEETDGNKIKNKWEHTQTIKTLIQQDQSKSGTDLTDSDYKTWCDTQLKKELGDDGIYQDKYVKIKSVCKQRDEKTK